MHTRTNVQSWAEDDTDAENKRDAHWKHRAAPRGQRQAIRSTAVHAVNNLSLHIAAWQFTIYYMQENPSALDASLTT